MSSAAQPIVFELTPADVSQTRKAIRKQNFGNLNPFFIPGVALAIWILQPALRFARNGPSDALAWIFVAIYAMTLALVALILYVQLHARVRRTSVTIGDVGLMVIGDLTRPSKSRSIPWKKIRGVYLLDDAFVVASGLRTIIIPKRAVSDASALEALFADKLIGKKGLLFGIGLQRVITNSASR